MQTNQSSSGIDPKKYYSVAEAADLLGVHRSTVWRWVKNLRLQRRVRKVNQRNEFLGADLLKFYSHTR